MANAGQAPQAARDPFAVALDELLIRFKNRLTATELRKFKGTTLQDVKKTLVDIEKRQETQRELRNLTRIRGFLDAMEQFGKVIEVFTNSSNMVAFIWGPLKFLLQMSSTWANSLDRILEAYQQIGEVFPLLQQYESLFIQHTEMRKILVWIYKDILEFHTRVIRFFDHPIWRQLFRSAWNDFTANFDGILKNFSRHNQLIESQFLFLHARQYESDRGTTATHRTELTSKLNALSQELHNAHSLLQQAEEERKAERLHAIQEWIGGNHPGVVHEMILEARADYSSTGNWVKNYAAVSSWINDDLPRSSTLWMHGMPGAGKFFLVLASIIIQACINHQQHRTAYYYCRSDDSSTLSCLSILKGLLMQQVHWYPNLVSYFREQRYQKSEITLSLESTARQLFETVAWERDRQYIILDGLDECLGKDRKTILSFLMALIAKIDAKTPSKFRLLVISQSESDIRNLLERAQQFEIKAVDNAEDIAIFVRTWMIKLRQRFELEDGVSISLEKRICALARATREDFEAELDTARFPKELSEA
ncbi:uncharacterized protein A1O9_00289 [Exophiala aquamarina CBS 119918]|uniref:Uncharacterized protein n=1 Tax=Exophiala aquamarina CBS 119918 TaxID=1182545 RepID=A0A072PRG3_9EURO|nr:uncharacterized protein A1O9_00289 [Exophiala aquamarina CBS 119918]KEF62317.1 hypothetical protein A1O9_00289 [Exophiala aquamarina CBS 119918]